MTIFSAKEKKKDDTTDTASGKDGADVKHNEIQTATETKHIVFIHSLCGFKWRDDGAVCKRRAQSVKGRASLEGARQPVLGNVAG